MVSNSLLIPVGAGITFLMSVSDGTLPKLSLRNERKGTREGGNGQTKSYSPRNFGIIVFDVVLFFLIFTGTRRVNNFDFPPQEGVNGRTDSSTTQRIKTEITLKLQRDNCKIVFI